MPSELVKPTTKQNVYDLVKEAGLDVSDWNFKKNGEFSANPKQNRGRSSSWAFIDGNEAIAVTVWWPLIDLLSEPISTLQDAFRWKEHGKGKLKAKGNELHRVLGIAFEKNLPIRVIFNVGRQRGKDLLESQASGVKARSLDSEPWHVSEYDADTGKALLVRGMKTKFVDQFTIEEGAKVDSRLTLNLRYDRSAVVRASALKRANGACEHCGIRGFETKAGQIYLETHHIIYLSENGPDALENVAAICANCHSEAHSGKNAQKISQTLSGKIANR